MNLMKELLEMLILFLSEEVYGKFYLVKFLSYLEEQKAQRKVSNRTFGQGDGSLVRILFSDKRTVPLSGPLSSTFYFIKNSLIDFAASLPSFAAQAIV